MRTLENMYDRHGFFHHQKGRLLRKRYGLLRWRNGWRCRALASVIHTSSASTTAVEFSARGPRVS